MFIEAVYKSHEWEKLMRARLLAVLALSTAALFELSLLAQGPPPGFVDRRSLRNPRK